MHETNLALVVQPVLWPFSYQGTPGFSYNINNTELYLSKTKKGLKKKKKSELSFFIEILFLN